MGQDPISSVVSQVTELKHREASDLPRISKSFLVLWMKVPQFSPKSTEIVGHWVPCVYT